MPSDKDWRLGEAMLRKAGLHFERRGGCWWVWQQRGEKQYRHRYVDVVGLLEHGIGYAIRANQGART